MAVSEDNFVSRVLDGEHTTVSEVEDELKHSERYQLVYALGEAYANGNYDENEIRVREDILHTLGRHQDMMEKENWFSQASKTALKAPYKMVANPSNALFNRFEDPEKDISTPERTRELMNRSYRPEGFESIAIGGLGVGLGGLYTFMTHGEPEGFLVGLAGTLSVGAVDNIDNYFDDVRSGLSESYFEMTRELSDKKIKAYNPVDEGF